MGKFGQEGSYQKITHYGDDFMADDELAWAGFVVVLFLCLPFSGSRKLILEIATWGLRLALLALLVSKKSSSEEFVIVAWPAVLES